MSLPGTAPTSSQEARNGGPRRDRLFTPDNACPYCATSRDKKRGKRVDWAGPFHLSHAASSSHSPPRVAAAAAAPSLLGSPVPRCGSAPPHDPDGKASARARRQAAPRALVPSKPWEDEYNPDEVDAVVGASSPREAMSEWKEASSAPRPRPRHQVPLRLQSSHATPAPAPRRRLR